MSTETTYPTFSQLNDPADISVYETDGMFCHVNGLIYAKLFFAGSAQDKLTMRVFTETGLFIQHIDTASCPELRIV